MIFNFDIKTNFKNVLLNIGLFTFIVAETTT